MTTTALQYEGSWGNKDPDAKRVFEIDWSETLGQGVTIVASEWSVVQGAVQIVNPAGEFSTTATKVTLFGGTDGETCLVKNSAEYSDGNNDDCTMRLDIRTT